VRPGDVGLVTRAGDLLLSGSVVATVGGIVLKVINAMLITDSSVGDISTCVGGVPYA
jgi:hypothetical protein